MPFSVPGASEPGDLVNSRKTKIAGWWAKHGDGASDPTAMGTILEDASRTVVPR